MFGKTILMFGKSDILIMMLSQSFQVYLLSKKADLLGKTIHTLTSLFKRGGEKFI